MQKFKNSQSIRTKDNINCQIMEHLGGGSQGEVYKIKYQDNIMALKWYNDQSAKEQQKKNLEYLIKIGPPSNKFLWPLQLVQIDGIKNFGYIMPFRKENFKSIISHVDREVSPTFRSLVSACYELAYNFKMLHAKGLCYCDISFGNVFFEPRLGDILICDNDNVVVNKFENFIEGTMAFMAPEIVTGRSKPDANTDRYSLSVLLFYLMFISHPLEGKLEAGIHCYDDNAKRKIYGSEPLFIFDPENDSNRPLPEFHNNAILFWKIYPSFIKKLYIKAFTDGLKDPDHGRVYEGEWCKALNNLRDSIFYCQDCGADNFYDEDVFYKTDRAGTCWNCSSNLSLPARLKMISPRKSVVMLNHDTRLYTCHIKNHGDSNNFSDCLAEVIKNPADPRISGLKNISGEKWHVTMPTGESLEVENEKTFRITKGVKVDFGETTHEIV